MYDFQDVRYSACKLELRARCHIAADHGFFKGHFEAQALMPAAAQLQMLDAFIGSLKGAEMSILGGRNIKFTQRILPDEEIVLELIRKNASTLEFTLLKADASVATKGLLNVKGDWCG